MRITLSLLSFNVIDTTVNEYVNLNKIRNKFDFFDIVYDELVSLQKSGLRVLSKNQQSFLIYNVNKDKHRNIYGRIFLGEYGVQNPLYDTQSRTPTYIRKRDEAELVPYFFLIHIPSSPIGALVIQKIGRQRSPQDMLMAILDEIVKNRLGTDFKLESKIMIPSELIKKIIRDGNIKKIRLEKVSIKRNIEDIVDSGSPYERSEEIWELVVKPPRGATLNMYKDKILEVLDRREKLQSIYQLPLEDMSYDNIKVEIQIGEKKRTIDLSNPFKETFGTLFDISKQIDIGDDGYPTFSSVLSAAKELLRDMGKFIW